MFTKQELQKVLPPKMTKSISDDLVLEINSIISDPDMYERVRENIVGYTNILQQGKYSVTDYINAVIYASYKMMGLKNGDAFARTFPDKMARYAAAKKSVTEIASFVSAYNKTKLVTSVLSQTLVPIHILNADILQEAINKEAWLMRNAKSEKVQHEAAKALMDRLAPPETTKIELDIGVKKSSVIEELNRTTEELIAAQRRALESGRMNARDIAESRIIDVTPDTAH